MSDVPFPIGENEAARLRVLTEMSIVDTIEEKSFDEMTEIISLIFKVPTVTISLLDETRQWFKSHHGLGVCETDRELAFCNYTILSDQLFEICDPLGDERFAQNPLVTGDFNLRYYCGAPIIIKGHTIGALCLIDYVQRAPLSAEGRKILSVMAKIVSDRIVSRHLLRKSTQLLAGMLGADAE